MADKFGTGYNGGDDQVSKCFIPLRGMERRALRRAAHTLLALVTDCLLACLPTFLSLTAPRSTTALHISCSLVPATAATVVVQAQAQAVAVWVVRTVAPEARVASAAQVPHQEWASA